eukprot:GFUD01034531.1.p2 GENE.GFUD01034531.1~~GFUD01034531.1.p2  ORF type:complete len:109 (+),score=28.02 GFUD01034531.1:299-625(+)
MNPSMTSSSQGLQGIVPPVDGGGSGSTGQEYRGVLPLHPQIAEDRVEVVEPVATRMWRDSHSCQSGQHCSSKTQGLLSSSCVKITAVPHTVTTLPDSNNNSNCILQLI